MAYWLVKSEPGTWSWEQHRAAGVDGWTGVRNHQAKAHLNNMKPGDGVLFYHSGEDKAVVGISEVVRAAYRDESDPTGAFVAVDLKAVKALGRLVTLKEIKTNAALAEMVLVKNSRLSVQPVTDAECVEVMKLGS